MYCRPQRICSWALLEPVGGWFADKYWPAGYWLLGPWPRCLGNSVGAAGPVPSRIRPARFPLPQRVKVVPLRAGPAALRGELLAELRVAARLAGAPAAPAELPPVEPPKPPELPSMPDIMPTPPPAAAHRSRRPRWSSPWRHPRSSRHRPRPWHRQPSPGRSSASRWHLLQHQAYRDR